MKGKSLLKKGKFFWLANSAVSLALAFSPAGSAGQADQAGPAGEAGEAGKPAVRQVLGKDAQKYRVLEFPANKAMGTLVAIDKGDPLSEKGLNFKRFGEARGKVECGPGIKLGLRLNYDGANDLSPLLKLRADDIVALDNKAIPIPAGQFQYLKNLTGLRRLELDDSDISDAELPYLKGCHDLGFLSVTRTLIKGPGLSVLRSFPHLRTLLVGHNALDENTLSGFDSLHEVKELHLDQSGIGDIALIHVGHMQALRDLRLTDNKRITDTGIAYLKGLKQLQSLDISGTSVTKDCVKTLALLPALRLLRISSAKVTAEELAAIGKQLRRCNVRGEKPGKLPPDLFAPVH